MLYPAGTIIQVVRNTTNRWSRPYQPATQGQKYLIVSDGLISNKVVVMTLDKNGRKTSYGYLVPEADLEPVFENLKMEDFL